MNSTTTIAKSGYDVNKIILGEGSREVSFFWLIRGRHKIWYITGSGKKFQYLAKAATSMNAFPTKGFHLLS